MGIHRFLAVRAVSNSDLGVDLVSIFFGYERDSARQYRLNRLPLKPQAYKGIRRFLSILNKLGSGLGSNPTLSASTNRKSQQARESLN